LIARKLEREVYEKVKDFKKGKGETK